jgi:hypothetical protein
MSSAMMSLRHVCVLLVLMTACGQVVSDDDGGDDDGDGVIPSGDCNVDDDCAPGDGCVVGADGSGDCRFLCTPFEDGGCASGESCVIGAAYGVADTGVMYCLEIGTVQIWQACSTTDLCAAGLSCLDGTCVPNCDDSHPCEDSLQTCTPPPNYAQPNPSNAGACQ